jgi:geranylgeranyl pyrophosphate synthase
MLTLSELKALVDSEISTEYLQATNSARFIDPSFAELLEEMAVFIQRGGKRFRPYLAYLLYVGLGGTDSTAITRAGAALEIFHNFLLIHDDIIDRDLVRYGGHNIEGSYLHKQLHSSTHRAEDHARAAALLGGDIAQSLALSACLKVPVSEKAQLALIKAFIDTTLVVAGGEFMDTLGSSLTHTSLTEEQIRSVYFHKTAQYTFYLPFQVACILTNQDEGVLSLVHKVAGPIGLAYQMRDDYLGIFGNTSQTGKPITSDVREGKQTLYYALMQSMCSAGDLADLDQLYGNPRATEEDVYRIREICNRSGATEAVEEQIQDHYNKAITGLDSLPLTSEARQQLAALFLTCIERHG